MESALMIRDLGDGLILRHATSADTDRLVRFNSITHSETSEPDPYVAGHTLDLICGRLPGFQAGDFTIVEDTQTRQIVSSLSLIPQTWAYEGIPFKVGRPEIVGTAPAYRRRGLVREQFNEVHQWSQTRGEMVQVITGNPWYYRQFGYEMALTLGGGRAGFGPQIPRLETGDREPYAVRPASKDDLPLIARLYDRAMQRQPLHCLRDEALWQYELDGRSEKNLNRKLLYVIESQPEGGLPVEPLGYFALTPWLWGTTLWLSSYEIAERASWLEITPTVLRFLWSTGEVFASRNQGTCERFALGLGAEHPVYAAFSDCLPVVHKTGAWYMRVPDLPAFLRLIAPALEKRLASSIAAGYSGEAKISFYRSGLRLVLEKGCFKMIEAWSPTQEEWGNAAFPDLTFLQLLFGFRSLEDLQYAFPDCWVGSKQTACLLNALFPRQPSDLWGLG